MTLAVPELNDLGSEAGREVETAPAMTAELVTHLKNTFEQVKTDLRGKQVGEATPIDLALDRIRDTVAAGDYYPNYAASKEIIASVLDVYDDSELSFIQNRAVKYAALFAIREVEIDHLTDNRTNL